MAHCVPLILDVDDRLPLLSVAIVLVLLVPLVVIFVLQLLRELMISRAIMFSMQDKNAVQSRMHGVAAVILLACFVDSLLCDVCPRPWSDGLTVYSILACTQPISSDTKSRSTTKDKAVIEHRSSFSMSERN